MTEVELGKVAEKNGQRDDVKSFGTHMAKDHGKANEELKNVASKMNVTVPDKVSAELSRPSRSICWESSRSR